MKFSKDRASADVNVIRAYAPGRINVNDTLISRSFILSPGQLIEDWAPQAPDDITLEHLQAALALKPEILVIGTGTALQFPAASLTAEIQRRGIGLEVLDTAAACRTYNVLVSENRNVVAVLLMI
ncbi:MAG TPA: Mth938-like domain-containing protein [Gammaproteobacteria bacterium]|nr:Mth938-like domain-containing protein [Gammaproteobacteria bacterium]